MNETSATTADPNVPVSIGATGVAVTRLGLGMSHLSGASEAVSEQQAHATVLRVLGLGIRHFDVAPAYGLVKLNVAWDALSLCRDTLMWSCRPRLAGA